MQYRFIIMKKLLVIGLLLASCSSVPAFGREFGDSLRYRGEIGVTFSDGAHTPFWMVSDHYGFSGLQKNNGWIRAGIFHDLDHDKRFSWGAGVELGGAYNFQEAFIPQQIYAEVKYRCLNAMIGQKEMPGDLMTSDLSSGNLTASSNARPIPQFRIGIFDYADVWGCKGWFAVKGYIGYGMFTQNRWMKDHYRDYGSAYTLNQLYCTRAIYFKFGDKRQFPLVGELGLRMDSQFGGTTYTYSEKDGWSKRKNPSDLKAWIKGMIPLGGESSTPMGEQLNVQGNFLGNWTFALGWYDPNGWSVKAYYQHFFEDHSMLFFDYPWKDGLWGLEGHMPKNPFISEAVIEYITTRDQSGPAYYDHTPALNHQVSSVDQYYNHYIYQTWSNFGYAMGNPFLISPIYNGGHQNEFLHNRIDAWNIGLKGDPTRQVSWKLRMSGINSWGTYSKPTRHVLHDFSMLVQASWHPAKLKGWEGTLTFALDNGNLIGKSAGFGITISKTGFIKF